MKYFFALLVGLTSCITRPQNPIIMIGSTAVEVDTVYTGLDIPWEIIYGPDGFIWTTERKGIVSRIDPVAKTKTVILNIVSNVYQQGESGMLGMTLHPDFENTPEVFLVYTYGTSGNIKEKIVKYTFNGTNLVNEIVLLDNIAGYTSHDGSRLLILPDNTLLMSTGDAQNTSLPQNTSSLNGKILRMNLDGSIPADNTIVGNYMYSYGHRNVQGLLMAPNNKIYLSEHGATTDDEFQILEAGRNYGWPDVEGFCDTPEEQTFCTANNVKEPLAVWTPTVAPSDLVYYENSLFPEFDDRVLMTTLKDQKIIALKLNADGTAVIDQEIYLTNQFGRLRDICVGPEKEIYLATNGNSWSNSSPNTHSIIVLRVIGDAGLNNSKLNISVKIFPNPINEKFQLEVPKSFIGAKIIISDSAGRVFYQSTIKSISSSIDTSQLKNGRYDLKIVGIDGKVVLKEIVK